MDQLQTIYQNSLNVSLTQYCSSGAVQYSVVGTLVFGTLVYLLNKITGEYSWVDRVWSLLPVIYGAHFLYHQNACTTIPISTRQIIMFSLTSLWGIRLTYNFYRKGGYKKGGQDYRWQYIRKNYHWSLVEILNIVFISYYQIILILWFSAPVYAANQGPLNLIDILLAVLWLGLFLGEVTADQQQWNFQTEKYRLLKEHNNNKQKLPSKYKRGFIIDGLFKFSRHPNFFCEICIWWVQFLFSYNSIGLNWTGLGALLLNLLFLGSTTLTQRISCEKYPQYKAYQQTTSMLIPLPSSKKYQQLKKE